MRGDGGLGVVLRWLGGLGSERNVQTLEIIKYGEAYR